MTDDNFHGQYKGHEIDINRESDDDFYIIVTHPDGTPLYDGWWAHGGKDTVHDAVNEALRGAMLI